MSSNRSKKERETFWLTFWIGFCTCAIIAMVIFGIVMGIKIIKGTTAKDSQTYLTEEVSDKMDLLNDYPLRGYGADDGYLIEEDDVLLKMLEVESVIDYYYVDSVSNDIIADGVYRGMIDSIDDPYARYYTAEELMEMMEDSSGTYYGIGAYLTLDTETKYPMITRIIENTPAEEAGLMPMDYIVKAGDTSLHGMELSDAVALIKGEEGTTVHLTIYRDNEYLEYDIVRRKVETPTVEYRMLENDIAYIAIYQFAEVTPDQFAEAYAEAKGSGMKGLIVDLRDNPGGLLYSAVEIGKQILPKGLIVYTEDKYGERDEYDCDGEHEIEVPMVVLVNGNSASAAEILSGAIKDYGVGTLVGTTTFGKGIVQRVVPLVDNSAVKLTVSHYYTPLGNDIHECGISPDVEIELDVEAYLSEGFDNQLEKAQEVIAGRINGQ